MRTLMKPLKTASVKLDRVIGFWIRQERRDELSQCGGGGDRDRTGRRSSECWIHRADHAAASNVGESNLPRYPDPPWRGGCQWGLPAGWCARREWGSSDIL